MKKLTLILLATLNIGLAHAADPLDSWHKRTSPTDGGLNAVTFANGRFVAVGDRIGEPGNRRAFIVSSPDGSNWDLHSTDLFVAVGDEGAILQSDPVASGLTLSEPASGGGKLGRDWPSLPDPSVA
ncbi:MAG: hypothetical protein AB9869_20690 [Verrucomicrobiia bacterium]